MQTADTNSARLFRRANDLWWVRIPAQVNRVFPTVAAILTDGLYLSVRPMLGAILPPLAVLIGLIFGCYRVGYNPADGLSFLYSLTTVLVFILVSQHGAALGFWMWLGFAVGDLVSFAPPLSAAFGGGAGSLWHLITAFFAPRLLADAILATLVMLIPAATSALTQSAVRHAQRHMIAATESGARRRIRLLSAVFARAAFNLIAVYLWLMAASVMAQGVYTWSGSSALTHGLVQSWKLNGFAAALVAAYAAGVRSVLVLQAQSGLAPRLQELRNAIAALPPSAFRRAALPLRAAFLTLLCGAFVDSWVGAIQLFLVVLGIFALRELAQLYATPWSSALARVPLFVRAIVAFLVVYLGVKVLLGATAAAATFFPAELAATLSLVIFALALPGPAQPPPVPLRAVVEA